MSGIENFETQLAGYRQAIDTEVETASARMLENTLDTAEKEHDIDVQAYCEILSRGGKRIRGSLVINGYEMCGGTDQEMIIQAACAVEMMHAFILVIDDIQDRSAVRRGGPSAHKIIEGYSQDHGWTGEHAHTGISLAIDGALEGAFFALDILEDLNVEADRSRRVRKHMYSTMRITAKGQTGDIINEVNGEVTAEDIERVIERKTAYYTISSPLQIGMILAGASQDELEEVELYSMATGKAFQATDDALTYISDSLDKDHSADIRDGKMTLIMHHALKNLDHADSTFVRSCLGKQDLSSVQFRQCVALVKKSGAIDAVIEQVGQPVKQALDKLQSAPYPWRTQNVDFLRGLAGYVLSRSS